MGRNFMTKAALDEWLKSGQVECDVMVMHQLWTEFMGPMHSQASLEQMEKCKLVVTGDFHQFKIITTNRGVRVLSPGATQMQKINEPTTHYVHILRDDLSIDYVQLKSRGVFDVQLETEDQVQHLAKQAQGYVLGLKSQAGDTINQSFKPIIRFKINNPIQAAVPRLEESFGPHAVVFFINKDEKSEEAPLMYTGVAADLPVLQEATVVMADNFPPDDPNLRDALNLIESTLPPVEAVRQLRSQYVEVSSDQAS